MGKITVIRDDITRLDVDAIVNAANSALCGGGGVDGAIHDAAGPELLAECRTLGGCEAGSAKATAGYRLPAEYVIHGVGPVWYGGHKGEAALLASCYRRCLEIAEELRLRTVAFPAISCGAYRFPVEDAACIAISTVQGFLEGNTEIESVVFACPDPVVFAAFDRQNKVFLSR